MLKLVQFGPHCTGTPTHRTCSNLFKLALTVETPPLPGHYKLVYYEGHTVGRQAIGILLQRFLVIMCIWSFFIVDSLWC